MITTRQNTLLEFLRRNQNKYLSQYEISQALPKYYFYDGEPDDFHNSKARLRITADIRNINLDTTVNSLILSNSRGVKIATQEEFEQGMKAEFSAIFRRLKRAYEKARKGTNNGQLEFDENSNIREYKIFRDFFDGGRSENEGQKSEENQT